MALRLRICTKELRFERGCSLAAAAAAPITRKRVEEAHRAFTRGEAEFDFDTRAYGRNIHTNRHDDAIATVACSTIM